MKKMQPEVQSDYRMKEELAGAEGLEPTTLGFGVRPFALKTNSFLSNRTKIAPLWVNELAGKAQPNPTT